MSINLPSSWINSNIESTCDILDSQRIPLNEEDRKTMKGDIPYYGANGVVDYINKHIFDEKLILLAEDGGYFSAYKTRPIAYLIKGKSWVNNHAHVLRVREKNGLVTDYVYYTLQHKNIMRYIVGSTRTKLNQAELRKIPVLVPPVVEQRGIAEVLGTVDEAIRLTDRVIERTEELKRGLMQRLLTQGIGHTEFKDTPLGKIPKTWNIMKIKDVADTYSGGTPSRSITEYYMGKIPWIKSGEINKEEILDTEEKITEEALKNSSAKMVKSNTLLMAMYGATAGKVAITKIDASINQAIAAIVPKKNLTINHYLYYSLQLILNKVISRTQGSGQPNLSQTIINNIELALPPLNEQIKISEIITTIDYKNRNNKNYRDRLNTIKEGLMQILLSANVRVELREDGLHRIGNS